MQHVAACSLLHVSIAFRVPNSLAFYQSFFTIFSGREAEEKAADSAPRLDLTVANQIQEKCSPGRRGARSWWRQCWTLCLAYADASGLLGCTWGTERSIAPLSDPETPKNPPGIASFPQCTSPWLRTLDLRLKIFAYVSGAPWTPFSAGTKYIKFKTDLETKRKYVKRVTNVRTFHEIHLVR